MRNLKECQAEVFRRSEQRIQKRKQRRKQILTACAPLVLCLALIGIFLPKEKPANPADPGGAEVNESIFCELSRIDVSGGGVSVTYTDARDVQPIADLLNTLISSTQHSMSGSGTTRKDSESVLSDREFTNGMTAGSTGDAVGYTVTVTMSNGASTVYLLTGSTLRNLDTHQRYSLTSAQLAELQTLLGISR